MIGTSIVQKEKIDYMANQLMGDFKLSQLKGFESFCEEISKVVKHTYSIKNSGFLIEKLKESQVELTNIEIKLNLSQEKEIEIKYK